MAPSIPAQRRPHRSRRTQAAAETRITNQLIINAFARASRTLGYEDPWAMLARAGLDLVLLAGDREGSYQGPAIDQMPNLTEAERAALTSALQQLSNPDRPQSPPAGSSLLRHNVELLAAPLEPSAARAIPEPAPEASPGTRMMARIWNRYGGLLGKVGAVLTVDPTLAGAVLAVESGGRAFSSSGRMIIRFELHIFQNLWGKDNPDLFNRHFRTDAQSPWRGETHQWRPDEDEGWRPLHSGQEGEWAAFSFARVYCSDRAAKLSISMGAPQIMGFNHARIGYGDVDAMYDAFENDERSQILGFFDFVRTDPRLLDAMRSDDLLTFATYYNGVSVAETYAGLMRDAVATLRRLLPASALEPEPPSTGPSQPTEPAPDGPAEPVGPHGSVRGARAGLAPRSAQELALQPDQLPAPPIDEAGHLREIDPTLYTYWREHVREGFEQNNEMFNRILDAFMEPYYTTVWMYRVIFAVGVLSFLAAVGLSIWTGSPWYGVVFGGLSAAAFISYFFNRPLQALEENLHFITWLGIIYNSYWTRLAYMFDRSTMQKDLRAATEDAVQDLDRLLDKHAHMSGKRPNARARKPAEGPDSAKG